MIEIVLLNSVPFVLALVMMIRPLRVVLGRATMTWSITAAFALLFVGFLTIAPDVLNGETITYTSEWVPSLGLTLTWYLDGLSLLFALIVTGVGVAVFLYAGYYLDDVDELGRFYMYLAAFAGSMLALVLAGNVFMLFIAWEGTSVMSFLLIGFKGNESEDARISASRALIITGGGGLALIAGLVLLGVAVNLTNGLPLIAEQGFQLATILETDITGHPWYTAFTLLIMLGCFTKSAQFPFHFWLPGAMTAPSPASAYLHSATMVKAGIYLLFRLYPTLHDSWLWTNGLLVIGLTTMLLGAVFAIRKRDIKAMLAYATVSKLGVIIALIGLPESHGLKAATISIIAHALYKATFFLMAGTIEHATGTRNLDELGGLARRMPVALVIVGLAALSMAGYPPFIGFEAKEFYLDELLPLHGVGPLPVMIAFVASIFTVVAAFLYVWDTFIAPHKHESNAHHFHAPPLAMHIGPGLLAGGSLVLGVLVSPILTDITSAVIGEEAKLYVIPPDLNPLENTALGLSLLVLIGGPVLFSLRHTWMTMPWFNLPTGASLYAGFIHLWERLGDWLLRSQNGKVRHYLVVILGVVSFLLLVNGLGNVRGLEIETPNSLDALKILLLVLTLGATLASIIFRRHLLAALALGVSGYAIGGIFLLEPAPDVALVQFLVETMATVLIILMIARIDLDQRREVNRKLWQGTSGNRLGLLRDLIIAVVMGGSVMLFALGAVNDRDSRVERIVDVEEASNERMDFDITEPIAQWYLENAYEATEAEDVVASILADFRGTDTLFEITVFATAALGLLTLLSRPQGGELLTGKNVRSVAENVIANENTSDLSPRLSDDAEKVHLDSLNDLATSETFSERHNIPRFSTPLTRLAATLVLPFAIMISFAHMLYGGSGPGDGFTAGVVSGLGVALWFVVYGYFEARARLSWLRPGRLIAAGLSLALGNAVLGMFISDGFLAIAKYEGDLPAGLHATTTLIFEFAIYLTVFGGVTMIMNAIADPGTKESVK